MNNLILIIENIKILINEIIIKSFYCNFSLLIIFILINFSDIYFTDIYFTDVYIEYIYVYILILIAIATY